MAGQKELLEYFTNTHDTSEQAYTNDDGHVMDSLHFGKSQSILHPCCIQPMYILRHILHEKDPKILTHLGMS